MELAWNFQCLYCNAKLLVRRIKEPFRPGEKAFCLNCMHNLPPRDADDLLQYELIERPPQSPLGSRMTENKLGAEERRLLELLAGSEDGCTDALLTAHGFAAELVIGLVHAGLATAMAEQTFAAGRAVDVTRVRITDAGRRALAG